MEDTYPTPVDKIALVATSSRLAKQVTVSEDGIGEDLPFNLMVWRDDQLTAICQLDSELRDEHPGERLARTVNAAFICRRGFDATAFTFVTEGFCATDPELIDPDVPLAQQFVTNTQVRECLTLTHIEAGNVYLSAQPYTYELGRRVVWGDPLYYEPTHPGTNQFLSSMVEVLLVEVNVPFGEVADPFAGDSPIWQELVAKDVSECGFNIQYGLDLDVHDPSD